MTHLRALPAWTDVSGKSPETPSTTPHRPPQPEEVRTGAHSRRMATEPYALPRLLTTEELAEYLGAPVRTVEPWQSERSGPLFISVGRKVRYREDRLLTWMDERNHERREIANPPKQRFRHGVTLQATRLRLGQRRAIEPASHLESTSRVSVLASDETKHWPLVRLSEQVAHLRGEQLQRLGEHMHGGPLTVREFGRLAQQRRHLSGVCARRIRGGVVEQGKALICPPC